MAIVLNKNNTLSGEILRRYGGYYIDVVCDTNRVMFCKKGITIPLLCEGVKECDRARLKDVAAILRGFKGVVDTSIQDNIISLVVNEGEIEYSMNLIASMNRYGELKRDCLFFNNCELKLIKKHYEADKLTSVDFELNEKGVEHFNNDIQIDSAAVAPLRDCLELVEVYKDIEIYRTVNAEYECVFGEYDTRYKGTENERMNDIISCCMRGVTEHEYGRSATLNDIKNSIDRVHEDLKWIESSFKNSEEIVEKIFK